ncbi:efflux transporter outer membrane subunit [Telluria mixta]|uniref:Efflux transporter outer membrane subunit n=1 Tax=Telluria mixta TaxID=34071 RepID=A0ABT2BXN2_9BURK|nr:efflux transporter outer membrane subunit [Telluria mixta]MCS0629907.1 efflux transporter outer membrane subunit [Telluria mixta]WEM96540.1 efflux transporter outer membrane subunit [Telluria mixta]
MNAPRLTLLSLLLAGCATGPAYHRPDVPVTTYKETTTLPAWKYAEPAELDTQGRWWLGYGDTHLSELVEEAGRSNDTIRISEARYRQALALAASSRASLFPFLDLTGGAKRGTGNGAGGAGNVATSRRIALEAGWEADVWGRVRNQAESSRLAAEAGAADLAAARLAVQATVAQLYFQVRVVDAQQRLLDSTVQAYECSLQLTQQRLRFGVATPADVAQAQAQLKTTQAQAVDNRVQRSQLEHALAVLLGREPASFALAPAARVAVKVPVVPAGVPSKLLERRPDVAAAERRVASANASVGAAQAAYFPDLTLSAMGGFQSTDGAHWLTVPHRVWALGPALAVTLFDGGARRAQTDSAIAVYDATVAGYRQTVLDSVQEVEDALALLAGLEQESELLEAAVQASRESERQMLARYRAGTTDYLSVVTVQATALAAERSALAAQGRRLAASVSLVKALGGGWNG